MKILVHSSWSNLFARLGEATWHRNKAHYCEKHGYIPMPALLPDEAWRDPWGRVKHWSKILDSMEDGDWLFFSGADAAISSPETKLESFIGDYDFFCGLDNQVVHGDGWMIRACDATRAMFQSISNGGGANEQEALVNYLRNGCRDGLRTKDSAPEAYAHNEAILNHSDVRVRLIRHTDKFTGDDPAMWPDGRTVPKWSGWTPEHLMLHVGGKTTNERLARMSEYFTPKIASKILLTHYSDLFAEMCEVTDPSKIAYCRQWGMEYRKVKLDLKSGWDRPLLWKEHLSGCEGIFFMGADAMITNLAIEPKWHAQLTIALDASGLNNDVFFMKNGRAMQSFLDKVNSFPDKSISEQEGMLLVLTDHPNKFQLERSLQVRLQDGWLPPSDYLFKTLAFMVKPWGCRLVQMQELNAYPQWAYGRPRETPYGWQPGNFVLHATGMEMVKRMEILREAAKSC